MMGAADQVNWDLCNYTDWRIGKELVEIPSLKCCVPLLKLLFSVVKTRTRIKAQERTGVAVSDIPKALQQHYRL